MSSDWVLLTIAAVLFIGSTVLALAETAFVRMNRIRALALAEEGRRGAAKLARMLERPERTLNVVLLLVLVTQLTTATLVGIVVEHVGGWLAVVVGISVQIVLFFVIGEVAPKTFAVQHTDRAALRVTPLLWAVTNFWPLRVLSSGLIGLSNVILPGKGLKRGPFVTEEEIRTMADVAAQEQSIEREERRLIHSIFEFGDTIVREVMLPRTDMVAVEADATVDEGVRLAIEGGYSRLPAYDDSLDDIVGLVYLKDLVKGSRAGRGSEPVRSYLRPAVFVPEQKRVAELLREMQQQKFHMAVVFDEYGGTAGLVTMEDLLEEIVGEITDEYDVEEPQLERLADGSVLAPGKTSIDDVNEVLGCDLPHEEWDTVGGLVFSVLGRVPEQREALHFGGYEFRAERVEGRRIATVRITPVAEREPVEPAGEVPERAVGPAVEPAAPSDAASA